MRLPVIGKDTLIFAILVAAVTAGFNWLIERGKANLNVATERREYLRQELSDFYYPVYLRLQADDEYWRDKHIWNELGGSEKSLKDRFGEQFEKAVILPNHEAMVDIINKHLSYVRDDDLELQEQILLYIKQY